MVKLSVHKWLLGTLLMLLIIPVFNQAVSAEDVDSPLIVTVFQSMTYDVSLIAGDKCNVSYIIPSGVDPHTYTLKPGDIDLLRNADIIISTRHTPVELQIDEMFKKGELTSKYIVINDIPGIKLYKNPNTGQWNLHMVIYDPQNYRLFLQNLTLALQEIDTLNSDYYQENLDKALTRLDKIVKDYTNSTQLKAIGSIPVVQYAVEWTGMDIIRLLVPEPGVGAGASDVNIVKKLMENGTVDVAVISIVYDPVDGDKGPVQASDKTLLELAEEKKIPVLRVPLPASPGTIIDKLEYIVHQLNDIMITITSTKASVTTNNTTPMPEEGNNRAFDKIIFIVLGGIVVGAIILSYNLVSRKH